MRWLFVTTGFPWPLTHGTWLRIYHMARALIAGGDRVSLISRGGDGQGLADYAAIGVDVLPGPPGPPVRRGPGRSFLSPFAFDAQLAECVARHAGAADAVVLGHLDALQYAVEARAAPAVVAEFVDDPILEWSRKLRRSPIREWVANLRFQWGVRFCERRFLDQVDMVSFVSDDDASHFARRRRGVRFDAIPNGVDMDYYGRRNGHNGRGGDRPSVVFVGNLAHAPNEDAAIHLVRDVAPKIRRAVSSVQVWIAGCNPSSRVRALSGPDVTVTGFVSDLRPVLWRADAVVLPMRMGTGIKNKLLEAWASGAPVVASPLACQGVRAEDGRNILIGRTVDELADKTVRVIRDGDLRTRLADQGREAIRTGHLWPMAGGRLSRAVRGLAREELS